MKEDDKKKRVAKKATEMVKDGMRIGLGTGSTVKFFLYELQKLKDKGMEFVCVPTSHFTQLLCFEVDLPVVNLNACPELDITFDGADQVDNELNVIKGRGGAHTREKIVSLSSQKFVIMVDDTKLSDKLNIPVPIEILPEALKHVEREISALGGTSELRMGMMKDGPVITDNGMWILDANFGEIKNPSELSTKIKSIAGVVEHGIFTNVDVVIVGTEEGTKVVEKSQL